MPISEDMGDKSQAVRSLANEKEREYGVDQQIARIRQELNDENAPTDGEAKTLEAQAPNKEKDTRGMIEEFFSNVPALGQGVLKGIQETGNLAIEAADALDNAIGDGTLLDKNSRMNFADDPSRVYQPKEGDMTEKIMSIAGQFILPGGMAFKAFKVGSSASKVRNFIKAGTVGAGVDFAVSDPYEENVSNVLRENFQFADPISELLAIDVKDGSPFENRAKNALEGLGIGVAAEGALKLLGKGLKTVRQTRAMNNKIKDSEEALKRIDDAVDEKPAVEEVEKQIKKEKLDATPDVDLSKLDEIRQRSYADKFTEAKRGVLGDKEAEELSQLLGMTKDDLLNRLSGEASNAETLRAQGAIVIDSYSNLEGMQDIIDKVAKGDATDVEAAQLNMQLNEFFSLQANFEAGASEGARALRTKKQLNKMKKMEKARYLNQYSKSFDGKEGLQEVATKLNEIMSTDGVQGLSKVSSMVKAGRLVRDSIHSYWMSGMLSGMSTHIKNIASNSTIFLSGPAELQVARAIGIGRNAAKNLMNNKGIKQSFKMAKESTDIVQEGEVSAQFGALYGSINEMFEAGATALKTGQPTNFSAKVKDFGEYVGAERIMEDFPAMKEFMTEPDGSLNTFGRTMEFIGKMPTITNRFLVAEDEFFKKGHQRMVIASDSVRNAKQVQANSVLTGKISYIDGNGVKVQRDGVLSDAEVGELASEFKANPTAKMLNDSIRFGETQTFTKRLEQGSAFGQLDKFIRNFKVLGVSPFRMAVPFTTTNMNMIEYSILRSPFAVANSKFHNAFKAGGAARDMALGRVALGTTVMGSVAMLGSAIKGGGPGNPKARKLWLNGNSPYSIDVGDTTLHFQDLGPFGQLLSFAADIGEISNEMNEENQTQTVDLVASAAYSVAENMTPEYMADNMGKLLKIFSATSQREKNLAVKDFMASTASSVVPFSGMTRNLAQLMDPVRRNTSPDPQSAAGFFEETFNKMKANTPWLSETLPAKKNIFAEEISIAGPIFPFVTAKKDGDAVIERMHKLGMNSVLENKTPDKGDAHLTVTPAQKSLRASFAGKQIIRKLTPEQHDRLTDLTAGKDLNGFNGVSLRDAIQNQMDIAKRKGENEEIEKIRIKNILSAYRTAARRQLEMEESDISDFFREERIMRQERLSAPRN